MAQDMEVEQTRSRRCDCCVEPSKNTSVCALIVVLITKIAEANAMTRNATCEKEHKFIITFLEPKQLLVCVRCSKIVKLSMDRGVDQYQELATLY